LPTERHVRVLDESSVTPCPPATETTEFGPIGPGDRLFDQIWTAPDRHL